MRPSICTCVPQKMALFGNKFVQYQSIFRILSLLDRRWNLQQNTCEKIHHTLNVLFRYLVECKRSKMIRIVQKLQ